ncbi:unnamed protein product [Adineta ricciae]|uniref:Uncharacterized protein n=1 Tax=Adineta ricciae TaxID=249248 RepID=A0A815NL05_ADIRI|nr:unnamed protein product [Adineta ricciae]
MGVYQAVMNKIRSNWPLVLLCCFLGIIGLVAAIVVLSLIPLYLSNNGIFGASSSSFTSPYTASYGTNFKSDGKSVIPNLNSLTTQLMSQYPDVDISVMTTTFIPTNSNISGKRRRQIRSINEKCEVDPKTTGDFLAIAFIIKPRFPCHVVSCKKKFDETFEKVTAIIRSQTTLMLTLVDGSTITIQITFCRTGQIQPVNPTTTNPGVSTATTTNPGVPAATTTTTNPGVPAATTTTTNPGVPATTTTTTTTQARKFLDFCCS